MRVFLFLILSAIALVFAVLVFGLFLRLTQPDNLIRFEIKRLGMQGARCSVYRSGKVNAEKYASAKGGQSISKISLAEFDALHFQAAHDGKWTRNNYNSDGSLKEVINLMRMLNLPHPPHKPMEQAKIPRRSYGNF